MKNPILQFFVVISLSICLCLALSGQKKTEKGITDEEAKALLENAPATGKKLSYWGVYIGRVVNGKSAEEWSFYNPLEMLLPLGYKLVPPEPPKPEEKN